MKPADLLRAIEKHQEMPAAACPRCAAHMDAASCMEDPGATPRPDDITVCVYCGAVLAYQADMSFRAMTDAEVAALDDETLLGLLDAIEGAGIMSKAFTASTPQRPDTEGAPRA